MKAPTTHRSSIFQILKQHFVGPKKIDLQVSAYGKLPIYKDFLRQGLAGQDAQAFRRWLDRGVSKFWAEREGYRGSEIPGHALMVAIPATGHQILGYLWGSHDHGGLRSFPFVLFVSLPVSKSPAPLSLLHALDQVVEQAQTMRRKLAGMHSLDEYYPFIRTARIHIEMHSEKSLREQLDERTEPTLGDLGDIFYGEDDRADRWPHLIRHVQTMAKEGTPVSSRLPRTEALPAWELNALWCLMLQDARRQSKKPLQLFYSPGDGPQGVTLLHRDLEPEDIFALHPEMPEYDRIHDLRREVPGARRPEPVADSTTEVLRAPDDAQDPPDHSDAAEETATVETSALAEPKEDVEESPEAIDSPKETSSEESATEANGTQEVAPEPESTEADPENQDETEEPDVETAEDLADEDEADEDEADEDEADEDEADDATEDPARVQDETSHRDDEDTDEEPQGNDGSTTEDPLGDAASDDADDDAQEDTASSEDDTVESKEEPEESEESENVETDASADEGDVSTHEVPESRGSDALTEDTATPTKPAHPLTLPKIQSALGKAQRARPPVALLDPDFWSE